MSRSPERLMPASLSMCVVSLCWHLWPYLQNDQRFYAAHLSAAVVRVQRSARRLPNEVSTVRGAKLRRHMNKLIVM